MATYSALRDFLATRPRLPLGLFPTPLVPLERIGTRLGIDLWMKRDECSGVAMGGNKTRKLEYILADARRLGHDTIVTVGPLGGSPPPVPSGNLLLLEYLGATLHFSPLNYADPTPAEFAALRALGAQVTQETGGYWVPAGGTMPVAEPGYMNAVLEIAKQRGGRFDFDHVVVAIGTGSTTAGLLLGFALGGIETELWPIAVMSRRAVEDVFRQPTPAEFFQEALEPLGLPTDLAVPPHEKVFGFAEEGYGVPNAASDAAIRALAQEEGYLLDSVYTGKAFAGLMALASDGRIARGSRVLFVHTGGLSMAPAAEKNYRTLGRA